ncbi:unnamed protein product [Spirodela intermedia]|uniref:Uncharacterized protein n=1 Tax=Spirodela intermedia TaxID=51605 RepID=A0A7I8IDS6_SPIIN|nr:unnamed protein product [Spirodela intermedia]CAA6655554.1 unnamed protein product [Spirodela intermedia]
MVCVACLLPIFLIPVVNALRCSSILSFKIYGLFGWEYRKPVRTPPTCPFRPASSKNNQVYTLFLDFIIHQTASLLDESWQGAVEIQNPHTAGEPTKTPSQEDIKQD